MPLHSTAKYRADVYINPDRKELKALQNKYEEVKALLHGNDMYAWNADYGYHDEIRSHLHFKRSKSLGLYLCNYPNPKSIVPDGCADMSAEELTKTINEHPIIKKLGYKHI